MNSVYHTPIALTIAGSDSGGGAGIQADLKTFSALGSYGCSVITALTAQNTRGVQGTLDVDPEFVEKQLHSVLSDLDVKAVKVGMLSQRAVIETVVHVLAQYRPPYLVVDPVMVATSGDPLLATDALVCLKEQLLPMASLITPNLYEAALLLDDRVPENVEQMIEMVEPLRHLGARGVLLKGGHLNGEKAVDLYHDGYSLQRLEADFVRTRNTHGTGCTLSSAITALLARGYTLNEAVPEGKKYTVKAIANADRFTIGGGNGPVHHFCDYWP